MKGQPISGGGAGAKRSSENERSVKRRLCPVYAQDWSPEQRQVVFPTTSGNLVRYPFFLEKVWKPLLIRAKLAYRPYHSRGTRSRPGCSRAVRTSGGFSDSSGTPASARPPTPMATSLRKGMNTAAQCVSRADANSALTPAGTTGQGSPRQAGPLPRPSPQR